MISSCKKQLFCAAQMACPRCSKPNVDRAARCTGLKKRPCNVLFEDVPNLIRGMASQWAGVFQQNSFSNCNSLQKAYIESKVNKLGVGEDNKALINKLLTRVSSAPKEAKIMGCNFKRDLLSSNQITKQRKANLQVTTIMRCFRGNELYAMVEPADQLCKVKDFQWHGFFGFLVPVDWIMHTSLSTEHYVPFNELCALGLLEAFELVLRVICPSQTILRDDAVKLEPIEGNKAPTCQVCGGFSCNAQSRETCMDIYEENVQELLEKGEAWARKHESVEEPNWLRFQNDNQKKEQLPDGETNQILFESLPTTLTLQQSASIIQSTKTNQRMTRDGHRYQKLPVFTTVVWGGKLYAIVQMAKSFNQPPWSMDPFSFFGFPVPVSTINRVALDTMFYLPPSEFEKLGLSVFVQRVMRVRYPPNVPAPLIVRCEIVISDSEDEQPVVKLEHVKRKCDSPASMAAKRRKQTSDREEQFRSKLTNAQERCNQASARVCSATKNIERVVAEFEAALAIAQKELSEAEKDRQKAEEHCGSVESEIWFQ